MVGRVCVCVWRGEAPCGCSGSGVVCARPSVGAAPRSEHMPSPALRALASSLPSRPRVHDPTRCPPTWPQADRFLSGTKKVKRQMWWQKTKMQLVLVAAVLLLGLFIFLLVWLSN